MRKFLLAMTVAALTMTLHADRAAERLALEKELTEINRAMHEARLEAIRRDPELTALRKKILAMHKEMAIKLDQKPGMRALADKALAIREKLAGMDKDEAAGKHGK